MSELPPGFVLDQQDAGLPPGFVIDNPGVAEDTAKGIASGLGNQTLGVLGAPGLVREGISAATDYLGDKAGISPDKVQAFKELALRASPAARLLSMAPSPADLRQTVTDPIVSPDYQPQTTLGKVGKIGAEYSLGLADPAALASPAGLVRALASNVAAPAAASEAAGSLLEGTPYERAGRIGGAFLGGFGASKSLGALEDARALKNSTIPLSELKPQTSAGYDAVRDANVGKALPENALSETADQVAQALNEKNFRKINAPELHDIVDQIRNPEKARAPSAAQKLQAEMNWEPAPEAATPKRAPDVADLLAARTALKDQISTNPAAAFVALDKVERAIDKYSPGTMAEIRTQDKNWTGVKSSEALDKNLAKAEGSAASTNSGLDLGNRIRQRVDSLLNSPQSKYMSEDVKSQLEKVRDGTATQNTLRHISNYVGKGHGLGGAVAGEIIGHIFGNDMLGLAVGTAVGRGTNSLYTRSIAKSAKQAGDFIRRETPMGKQYAEAAPLSAKAAAFRSGVRGARIENRRAMLPAALAGLYPVDNKNR